MKPEYTGYACPCTSVCVCVCGAKETITSFKGLLHALVTKKYNALHVYGFVYQLTTISQKLHILYMYYTCILYVQSVRVSTACTAQ